MPSDQVWEELFKGTKDRLETYRSFQGKIKEDGQALCDCLAFDDGISQDIETLYVYAKQSLDQDTCLLYTSFIRGPEDREWIKFG